jgi:hypothetical protein
VSLTSAVEVRHTLRWHFCKSVLLWVYLLTICGRAVGQTREEPFILVNLNEHKPVPNLHLLFYAGHTPGQVRKRLAPMKLLTDSHGRTSVSLKPGMRWFQIWVDGSYGCSTPPDRKMVSHSSVLFDEGVIVTNTCSPALLRLAPDVVPIPVIP